MSTEHPDARLKRLKMRSWRRGTKEMDLILGPFADTHLKTMDGADLQTYDDLLNENDQDLYPWLTGQGQAPTRLRNMLNRIAATANTRD